MKEKQEKHGNRIITNIKKQKKKEIRIKEIRNREEKESDYL
jgi:hypothetical protein